MRLLELEGSELIGNVVAANSAGAAGAEIEKIVKRIKDIVEIVLKTEGNAEAGNDKKASNGSIARSSNGGNDETGKLFDSSANNGVGAAAGDAAKKAASDASKAVLAVAGADILKTIIKNGSAAAEQAKDATIAEAIALKAMTKGGKFPGASNTSDDAGLYSCS